MFKEAGGILIALKFLPGLLLSPISHHKMIIAASKELFLLKKKDANLFVEQVNEDKHKMGDCHYGVSFSIWSSLQIYYIGQYKCL